MQSGGNYSTEVELDHSKFCYIYTKKIPSKLIERTFVTMRRFELLQDYSHYHLKVACLPVSPHRRFDVAKLGKN